MMTSAIFVTSSIGWVLICVAVLGTQGSSTDQGTASSGGDLTSPNGDVVTEMSCVVLRGCCWLTNSSSAVQCFNYSAVVCPAVDVTDGSPNTTNTNYSIAVRVTCKTSFSLDPLIPTNNFVDIICTRYGNWSIASIVCKPVVTCPNLNSISTTWNFADTAFYNTWVSVKCAMGYALDPNDFQNNMMTTWCSSNGTWWPVPNCQPVVCGTSINLTNAAISPQVPPQPSTYDTKLKLTCSTGYDIDGFLNSTTSNCQADMTWSTPSLTCNRVVCPLPPVAFISTNATAAPLFGDTISYVCNTGYHISPGVYSLQAECQADRTFLPSVVPCKPRPCPNVTVTNGISVQTSLIYQSEAQVTCNVGYGIDDSTSTISTKCQADETWTVDNIVCYPINCTTLESPDFGTNSSATSFGSFVNITCPTGTWLNTNKNTSIVVQCVSNKTWSPVVPGCQAVFCANDPPQEDSTICTSNSSAVKIAFLTNYPYLTSVSYRCNNNNKFSDGTRSKMVSCGPNGQWNDTDITCSGGYCDPSPNVQNASKNTNDAANGTIVLYTCDPGFVLSSGGTTQTITCDGRNNIWSPSLSLCFPVNCTQLIVANSFPSTLSVSYATVVTFTCHPGYKVVDTAYKISSFDLECLANASWSAQPSSCQAVYCNTAPDADLATCTQTNYVQTVEGRYPYNTGIAYICLYGWKFRDGSTEKVAWCQDNGQWSENNITCSPSVCPPAPTVKYATPDTNIAYDGVVVTFTCNTSYSFPGGNNSAATRCNGSSWIPRLPDCEPIWTPCVGYVKRDRTFAIGGQPYPGDDLLSDQQCIDYCRNVKQDCTAAQTFDNADGTVTCLLHTPGSDLGKTYRADVATLYIIQSCPDEEETTVSTDVTTGLPRDVAWNGCNATWTPLPQQSIQYGLISYPQYTTVDDCKSCCAYLVKDCVAAQIVNTGRSQLCFIATEINSLSLIRPSSNADAYLLSVVCADSLTTKDSGNSGDTTDTMGGEGDNVNGKFTTLVPTTTTGRDFEFQPPVNKCFRPAVLTNSTVRVYTDDYGTVAIYTCLQGYRFASGGLIRSIMCLAGQWNVVITDCEEITCGGPVLSDAGTIVSTAQSTISTSQLSKSQCPTSNTLTQTRFPDGKSEQTRKCTSRGTSGVLSGQDASCKAARCRSPPLVINATASFDDLNRELTVTCIAGHRLPTGATVDVFKCNNDGTWNDIPACGPLFCSQWQHSAHSSINTSNVIFGTVAMVKCDDGFIIDDDRYEAVQVEIKCISDGSEYPTAMWTTDTLTCEPVFCKAPPTADPDEGSSSAPEPACGGPDSCSYQTSIEYTCNEPFKFKDGTRSMSVSCGPLGLWSEYDVSCGSGICDPVPKVLHANPNTTDASNGSAVVYTCEIGFTFSPGVTNSFTTCDGISWSKIADSCIDVQCPKLNLSNATWNSTSVSYLTSVTVECKPGYTIEKNVTTTTLKCQADASWSFRNGSTTLCKRKCHHLLFSLR